MIDRMDVAHDTFENTVYAAYLDGKEEERSRIVRNALKKNMAVEDIAELAGLTVAEVRNLITDSRWQEREMIDRLDVVMPSEFTLPELKPWTYPISVARLPE